MSNARNIADRGAKILAYVEVASGNVGITSNEYNISSSVDVQGSGNDGVYQYNFASTLSNPTNYHVISTLTGTQQGDYTINVTNKSSSSFTTTIYYASKQYSIYGYSHSCVVIGKSD
jgi:hypothetical protein